MLQDSAQEGETAGKGIGRFEEGRRKGEISAERRLWRM